VEQLFNLRYQVRSTDKYQAQVDGRQIVLARKNHTEFAATPLLRASPQKSHKIRGNAIIAG
jgi:hypothetical protein